MIKLKKGLRLRDKDKRRNRTVCIVKNPKDGDVVVINEKTQRQTKCTKDYISDTKRFEVVS